MTPTSVPAAQLCAAIPAIEPEETLVTFEEAVTESLASRIECIYGDASGIVSLHADLVEAGFEERSTAAEIAYEIDAQSRLSGVA